MTKVYCNNCKYKDRWNDWEDLCKHPEYTSIIHRPTYKSKHMPKCIDKNKHNDCSKYEPTLLRKGYLKIKELINEIQRT